MENQVGRGIFEDIDDDTAKLIIQLQLEDAENIAANLADGIEAPHGYLSDSYVALKLYRDEMQRHATVLQDRDIAEAVSRGLEPNDDELLIVNPADEGLAADEVQTPDQVAQLAEDSQVVGQAAQLVVDADGDALITVTRAHPVENNRESADNAKVIDADGGLETDSSLGSQDGPHNEIYEEPAMNALAVPRHPCIFCMDAFLFEEIAIVGGHGYCNPCLKETFTRSFIDEERFPPRYVLCTRSLKHLPSRVCEMYLISGVSKPAFGFRL
jgi:hypothetical protein